MSEFKFRREKTRQERAEISGDEYITRRVLDIGDAFACFRTNRIPEETLAWFIADALLHWKPASKGGAHKGGLVVPTVEGPLRLTRADLWRFYGLPNDSTLTERQMSGQTIQRMLQVVGCLYANYGADDRKAVDAVKPLVTNGFVTPRGFCDGAKRLGKGDAESVFRPLAGRVDPPTVDEIRGKVARTLGETITRISLIGRPASDQTEVESPWRLMGEVELEAIENAVAAARARLEKQALDELDAVTTPEEDNVPQEVTEPAET